ncbi:hypothetical protein Y1Q_0013607 [Alligator mississippiensis]|uniref:Uncharacterized protein n=1 Tax=Alligator mississippiensis TaxID=8496 RepID=A0A151P3I5_ALLMI|nr:hypothetical protein Y1Q_0013607 [Alligator mississippiensis]
MEEEEFLEWQFWLMTVIEGEVDQEMRSESESGSEDPESGGGWMKVRKKVQKKVRKKRCGVISSIEGGFIEESNKGRIQSTGRTGEEEKRSRGRNEE